MFTVPWQVLWKWRFSLKFSHAMKFFDVNSLAPPNVRRTQISENLKFQKYCVLKLRKYGIPTETTALSKNKLWKKNIPPPFFRGFCLNKTASKNYKLYKLVSYIYLSIISYCKVYSNVVIWIYNALLFLTQWPFLFRNLQLSLCSVSAHDCKFQASVVH